ncbi:MAG: AMP-binding protein [Gammaproteobacteria bacterium]|nr:AMP-binding protein [Gammaproteobacteria bacterium]
MSDILPITPHFTDTTIVAYSHNKAINYQQFLSDVASLRQQLPSQRYMINLCHDHYHFMVSFTAALLCQQTTILPSNQKTFTLQQLQQGYSDCYCMVDSDFDDDSLTIYRYATSIQQTLHPSLPLTIANDTVAAILFTSGSTGKPQAHTKTWQQLMIGVQATTQALKLPKHCTIVATIPAQHMFGFEHSICLPMQNGYAIAASPPFFPQDIANTVKNIASPKVLLTTPLHIKACLEADVNLSEVDLIISATSPLTTQLAQQAERRWQTCLVEIYGSTETGAMAMRHTAQENIWQTHENITIVQQQNNFYAINKHVPPAILLHDQLQLSDEQHFLLLGRDEDLINIAGKRASLTDLTLKLTRIAGIEDAILFMPKTSQAYTPRLTALVVSPTLSSQQIKQQLATMIDDAFLPRPIIKLSHLPRNTLGKIPYQTLLHLAGQYDNTQF